MFENAHFPLEIVTMARNGSGFFEDTKMSYYIRKKKKMPTSLLKYKVRAVFPRDNKVTGCSSSLEPQGPQWGQLFVWRGQLNGL